MTTDGTKFVVGLGNPTRKYADTRHNLGFGVIDVLAGRWQSGAGRDAFSGRFYDARPSVNQRQSRVMMLKPMTYMNRSGRAVREMLGFYKAGPDDLDNLENLEKVLIVLDDLDLKTGQLRARAEGSAGGHNGLADVLNALGTTQVQRLRIGIGPVSENMDPADYVLQPFGKNEIQIIEQAVERAADAVEDWLFNGIKFVMDRYNGNLDQ